MKHLQTLPLARIAALRPPYDRRMRHAMLLVLLLCAGPGVAQTFDELRPQMRAAIEAKDYARLTAVLEQMNRLRPDHPTVLANLASAYALTSHEDAAIDTLERIVAMKMWFDLSDSDFDSIRSTDRFVAITAKMDALRVDPVGTAAVAFTIPQKGLITEGIAVDRKSGVVFVSSARKGKVIRIARGGKSKDFSRGEPLHGLSGMGIDAKRRLLWACSSASPRVEGFTRGAAADASLVAFDLTTGAVVRRVRATNEKTFCDDVTVSNDGTVYVSDSTGAVLRLAPEAAAMETLVPHGTIRSPQGSVLSRDGRVLYVADYGGPLRAIDVQTGDAIPLRLPADLQILGIDGLTRWRNSLIAVQNGIRPHRVIRLDLAHGGLAVERATILAMNHPLMDEPTIGTVVGDTYYFVGTSEGHKFDRGVPAVDTLSEGRIFSIKLH